MHMASVNPDACDTPVRAFGTFTQDLHDLADWFKACGVTSIAMEATGVYWIPAFEVLEARGFDVIWSMRATPRMCRDARRRSAMRDGCDSCIPMACCAAFSVPKPRAPPSVPICDSGNGWSNMRLPISNLCRRR